MKEQNKAFKAKRDSIRNYLYMTRIGLKRSTYMKLMGQVVNGKKDGDLQGWEINDIEKGLDEVSQSIKEFRDELRG